MDEPFYLRRPNIFPKKSSDYPLLVFVSFMIPVTYWFEIWVVLPSLFSDSPVIYWIMFIVGHFFLHNVVGNFLGILIFDTSIRGRKMPSEKDPKVQYCSLCATYTPPRSYHCPSCDICILKRDHHCIFTGCCVGFYNHRFFILFAFYLTLSTLISFPFNIYFLWEQISITEFYHFFMIFCPALLFFITSESENIENEHIYLMISAAGTFGAVFCLAWLYFHIQLVLRGTLVHEMKKCINLYNFGFKKNVQMVFGKKWYLTWISPYVKSPLICDGISFPVSAIHECCAETSGTSQKLVDN